MNSVLCISTTSRQYRTMGLRFLRRHCFTSAVKKNHQRLHPLQQQLYYSFASKRTMVVVTQTPAGSLDVNTTMKESIQNSTTTATVSAAEEPVVITTNTSSENENKVLITDNCWNRIRQLLQQRKLSPHEMYLRLYVDAGGCSGFQYKFELTLDQDEAVDEDEDVVFSFQDMRVVIDKTSLQLVHGSTIDFVQELIKSAFVVTENPQSESACGCGSSFAIKNFASNPALD